MAGLIKWYLATKAWPSRVQYVLSYQRPRDMAIELGITRLNRPVPKHFKTIQASLLCILGRLEGGKKKARVGRWEGEREEPRPRGSRIFRFFYDRPLYDSYFSSFATFGSGVPSGSLFGGERIRAVKMMSFLRKFRWKFSDQWYWYFFRTESRNGGLSLSRSEQLSSTPVCIGNKFIRRYKGIYPFLLCTLAKCASSLPLLFMCWLLIRLSRHI